jgi:hypothetical protein
MSSSFFSSVRTPAGQKELEEITQNLQSALAAVAQVLQQAEKTFSAGSNGANQGKLIGAALSLVKEVTTTIQSQERPAPSQAAPILRS